MSPVRSNTVAIELDARPPTGRAVVVLPGFQVHVVKLADLRSTKAVCVCRGCLGLGNNDMKSTVMRTKKSGTIRRTTGQTRIQQQPAQPKHKKHETRATTQTKYKKHTVKTTRRTTTGTQKQN